MKKIALAGLAVVLFLTMSCEKSESSSGGIFGNMSSLTGEMSPYNWNFMLTSVSGMEKYYVSVQTGGGSGVAVVTARKVTAGVESAIPGAFAVFADAPFALTASGPTIQFSSTAGLFNMTKGDEWGLVLDSNQSVGFLPTKANTSLAVPTFISGVAIQTCQYGLFNGLPSLKIDLGGVSRQISSSPMLVYSSESQSQASIPETSLLLLGTLFPFPGASQVVKAGDQVEIIYDRTIVFDGAPADYFKVVAVSDRRLQVLDAVGMASIAKQNISRTFTSDGNFIGIQFISGLHSSADSVMLDNFIVKVNGVEVFSDNFDTGSLKPGFPNFMWMPANPPTMLGSAKVCGQPGDYSWCAAGGRSYTLYGQGGSTGLVFNISDASIGTSFWNGAFMGMLQGSALMGTYSGKNYDKTCEEQGAFFSLINSSQTALMAGNWDLAVQAQLKNCDNPADNGTPVVFTVNNMSMTQFSTLFGGALTPNPLAPPVLDSLGNQVQAGGFVNGNILMGMLATQIPATMFYRLSLTGIGATTPLTGQVTGWAARNPLMLFQTCDIDGGFSLSVTQ